MSIAILYESDEWSSYALYENVKKLGMEVDLINANENITLEDLLIYELIVNRVFASAQFRNNHNALSQIPTIISFLKENNIPMLNGYIAHFYEVSKKLSTEVLDEHGIDVPDVYGVFTKNTTKNVNLEYPAIIKPNCGGRTNLTYIVNNKEEFEKALEEIGDVEMIAQEYINPEYGYLTRIEVIDDECKLILKRSVCDNGLSAYKYGSTYDFYPECREEIKNVATKAMKILDIQMGSMDIIENGDRFYVIDVNSVSNTSEDCTELFKFDLMLESGKYIVKRYKEI